MGYNAQYPGGILRVGRSFDEWVGLVDNLLNTEKHAGCAVREKAPAIVGTIAIKPNTVLTGMRKLGDVDENAYDRIVDSTKQLTENGFITATDIPKEEQTELRAWLGTRSIPQHAARYMVAIQSNDHYWNTQAAWEAGAPAYAANVGMYGNHADRLNGALSMANHTGIQIDEGLYVTSSLAFVAATRENLPLEPQIVQV